jgi:2-polyprenyl-3-methyl-5-hydroxy-6-metoxy-1,4-benzoquinol methylase
MSQKSFIENIFTDMNDRERLVIQHDAFYPRFTTMFKQALDEYGLAQRLAQAQTNNTKIEILDVGCGEGLFLHDIANLLEERGLLQAAHLSGFDIDANSIANARQFAEANEPPRPELNFFVADASKPLAEQGINTDGYDFIMAVAVLEHLVNSQQHLQQLYKLLKPGGVIYTRSFSAEAGERGWATPHPAFDPLYLPLIEFSVRKNPGADTAYAASKWLQEWGAEMVQFSPDKVIADGKTAAGINMLNNWLMITRTVANSLIARGVLSQTQVDEQLAKIYQELTPEAQGHTTLVDTLARKPDHA